MYVIRSLLAVLLLLIPSTVAAQSTPFVPVYGTLQAAATATGNGTTLNVEGAVTVAIDVTISNTATITFEGTVGGTLWTSATCINISATSPALVTTATSTGSYQCNVVGFSSFRTRISAYTSGSVTTFGRTSNALFGYSKQRGLVASGGGGSGAPTDYPYWGNGASASLSAEIDLSALSTGLVINTAGTPSAFGGSSCATSNYASSISASGVLTCSVPAGGGGTHNLLSTTHPDTSAGSVVLGDLIHGDATPTWNRLAGNTTTTKKFLTQTGNGTISAVPGWGTLALTDLPSGYATLTDDAVYVANGATVDAKVVPNCTDTTGNHLNYTQSTNTFSCGTSSSGGAGTNNFVLTFGTGYGANTNPWTWVDAHTFNIGTAEIIDTFDANEFSVCIPIPVTSTLTKVYWTIRVNGVLQSNDGANTLKVKNQTAATTTTGTTATFNNNSTSANETGLTFAVTAGDCISAQLITASPATDPTNIKIHASLLFTVP